MSKGSIALLVVLTLVVIVVAQKMSSSSSDNFVPTPVWGCGSRGEYAVVREGYGSNHPPPPASDAVVERATVEAVKRGLRSRAIEQLPDNQMALEHVNDRASSMMANVTRRSPPVVSRSASSSVANMEVDSDFRSDGLYDHIVHETMPNKQGNLPSIDAHAKWAMQKENLTSQQLPVPNTLTANRTGLGSIRYDPRFEPPAPIHTSGGTNLEHGGDAGGPATGNFGNQRLMQTNNWQHRYVHGFGKPVVDM